MAAHFSRHFAVRHAGQDPLHERVAGASHDGTSTCVEDGLFNVHRTLDVVNDAEMFVVGGVFRKPVFVFEQVVGKQRNESVRVDEAARFVNGADAVAIAVGTEAEFAFVFNHGFAQVDHVFGTGWVRAVVGFCGVPLAEQVHVVHAHGVQQLGQERAWNGVTTVHCDLDLASDWTR